MKKIILLSILFLAVGLNAQISGYLGKRFYAKYDLNLSRPMRNDVIFDNHRIPKAFHNLTINYIVTENISLGLGFGYSNFNIVRSNPLIEYEFYYNNVNEIYIMPFDDFNIQTRKLSLNMRVFHGGFIAPLGRFSEFELIHEKLIGTDFGSNSEIPLKILFASNTPSKILKEYSGTTLKYTLGKSFMLNDFIGFSYGFYAGIHFSKSDEGLLLLESYYGGTAGFYNDSEAKVLSYINHEFALMNQKAALKVNSFGIKLGLSLHL